LKKLIILKALRKEGSKTEKAWMEAWGGGGFSVYKKSVENKCTRTKKTFFQQKPLYTYNTGRCSSLTGESL
jgi:hypothetical protein